MKKLIFLLLFVGFFSDASGKCTVYLDSDSIWEFIRENCVKDDILDVTSKGVGELSIETRLLELNIFAVSFCRYDREIIISPLVNFAKLSCVLNSTESRKRRR
jgi:hypothetical protein